MRNATYLPPLVATRVFAVVARHMSFRRAGEELLISQSAVSHHIRQLEEALGVRLFIRRARSIELTPEGDTFHTATLAAFALLEEATSKVSSRDSTSPVRVSLLPSFAVNWLASRLHGFQVNHPEYRLEIEPTLELADLHHGRCDLAIRYGAGGWGKDLTFEPLYQETLCPVASPEFLGSTPGGGENPLRHGPLLLTQSSSDWQTWASKAEFDLSSSPKLQLTDYNVALQAAIAGQGVAMGRMLLVENHIRAGRLATVNHLFVKPAQAVYWAVTSSKCQLAGVKACISWLKSELHKEAGSDTDDGHYSFSSHGVQLRATLGE